MLVPPPVQAPLPVLVPGLLPLLGGALAPAPGPVPGPPFIPVPGPGPGPRAGPVPAPVVSVSISLSVPVPVPVPAPAALFLLHPVPDKPTRTCLRKQLARPYRCIPRAWHSTRQATGGQPGIQLPHRAISCTAHTRTHTLMCKHETHPTATPDCSPIISSTSNSFYNHEGGPRSRGRDLPRTCAPRLAASPGLQHWASGPRAPSGRPRRPSHHPHPAWSAGWRGMRDQPLGRRHADPQRAGAQRVIYIVSATVNNGKHSEGRVQVGVNAVPLLF